MNKITVKKANRSLFQKLMSLDYTHVAHGMFGIRRDGKTLKLTELKLRKQKNDRSKVYTTLRDRYINELKDRNVYALVALYDGEPGGYLFTYKQKWPGGTVYSIDGILVAKQFAGKGLAKALLKEIIKKAKSTKNCRGIAVEMDTEKFAASKLLQKMGFAFAGAKLFVYSNREPHKFSKEAIYFFYKI